MILFALNLFLLKALAEEHDGAPKYETAHSSDAHIGDAAPFDTTTTFYIKHNIALNWKLLLILPGVKS